MARQAKSLGLNRRVDKSIRLAGARVGLKKQRRTLKHGRFYPSIRVTLELVPLAERIIYPPTLPLFIVTLSPALNGRARGVDCIQIWPFANRNTIRCLEPLRIAVISVSTSGWVFQSRRPPSDIFRLGVCADASFILASSIGATALGPAVDRGALGDTLSDCTLASLGNSRSKHSSRSFLSAICEQDEVWSA